MLPFSIYSQTLKQSRNYPQKECTRFLKKVLKTVSMDGTTDNGWSTDNMFNAIPTKTLAFRQTDSKTIIEQ